MLSSTPCCWTAPSRRRTHQTRSSRAQATASTDRTARIWQLVASKFGVAGMSIHPPTRLSLTQSLSLSLPWSPSPSPSLRPSMRLALRLTLSLSLSLSFPVCFLAAHTEMRVINDFAGLILFKCLHEHELTSKAVYKLTSSRLSSP